MHGCLRIIFFPRIADLQASDPANLNGGIAGYEYFRNASHGVAAIEDGVTLSYSRTAIIPDRMNFLYRH